MFTPNDIVLYKEDDARLKCRILDYTLIPNEEESAYLEVIEVIHDHYLAKGLMTAGSVFRCHHRLDIGYWPGDWTLKLVKKSEDNDND